MKKGKPSSVWMYKVVRKSTTRTGRGRLVSVFARGKAMKEYVKGKWSCARRDMWRREYGLAVFVDLQEAIAFRAIHTIRSCTEIWTCLTKGAVDLGGLLPEYINSGTPYECLYLGAEPATWDAPSPLKWPEGTALVWGVKLMNRVRM